MAINYIIQTLLFPPASLFLLILLGLIFLKHKPRTGKLLIICGLTLAYLSSIPAVTKPFSRLLHVYAAISPERIEADQPEAIVVMGGGRYFDASEYANQDTVSPSTLVRLRYAVRLAQQTGLPLLTTGGRVFVGANSPSEAQLMAQVVEGEWGIAVKWKEERSRNSYENALYSYEMLSAQGIENIILVTHNQHMVRSVEAFEHVGFQVTPAPTIIASSKDHPRPAILNWIPNAGALSSTANTLHELVGRLWYHLRYY